LLHIAAEIEVMVPPHTNGVGFQQKGSDFGGAVGACKAIDRVTEGDDLIDTMLAEQGQRTGQLGGMTVDISNKSQTQVCPSSTER
jgi:hypothetical protein